MKPRTLLMLPAFFISFLLTPFPISWLDRSPFFCKFFFKIIGFLFINGRKNGIGMFFKNMDIVGIKNKKQKLHEIYLGMGQAIFEVTSIFVRSKLGLNVDIYKADFKNPKEFEKLKNPNGSVIVIPHLGVLLDYSSLLPKIPKEFKVFILRKKEDGFNPVINKIFKSRIPDKDYDTVLIAGKLGDLKELLNMNNKIVLSGLDRRPHKPGIMAPFFGKMALTGTVPANCHMKNPKANVVSLTFRQTGLFKCEMELIPGGDFIEDPDKKVCIQKNTEAYNRLLEKAIMGNTTLWWWWEDRWNPPTEPLENS